MQSDQHEGTPSWLDRVEAAREILDEASCWKTRVPVSVEEALDFFGLSSVLVETGNPHHGGLRKVGETWHPVIYRPLDELRTVFSPRERFTILHEVAHFIIDRELLLRPNRNREYWQLESVCHEFAANVLIPREIAVAFGDSVHDAKAIVRNAGALAARCNVSLVAAAKQLVLLRDNTAAAGLLQVVSKADHRLRLKVEWTAGESLARVMPIGSYLPASSPIHRQLTSERDSSDVLLHFPGNKQYFCHREGSLRWTIGVFVGLREDEDYGFSLFSDIVEKLP